MRQRGSGVAANAGKRERAEVCCFAVLLPVC